MGPQNIQFPLRPLLRNKVTKFSTNFYYHLLVHEDGSMAPLSLHLHQGLSPEEWDLPANAAHYTIHYQSEYSKMGGISVADREGTTLFKTFENPNFDSTCTVSLDEGEVIVGFKSLV